MGFIERRNGRYRARYRDPLGRLSRKLDAERFLREVQVDIERGRWLDPSGAQLTLQSWSGEFLSLARRLSPTTQQTYLRDLDKYILPRFGAYRIGRLPTDEIEKWLMDEIEAGALCCEVEREHDEGAPDESHCTPLSQRGNIRQLPEHHGRRADLNEAVQAETRQRDGSG